MNITQLKADYSNASQALNNLYFSQDAITDDQIDLLSDMDIQEISGAIEIFEMMMIEKVGGLDNRQIVSTLNELYKIEDDNPRAWVVADGYTTPTLIDWDDLEYILNA